MLLKNPKSVTELLNLYNPERSRRTNYFLFLTIERSSTTLRLTSSLKLNHIKWLHCIKERIEEAEN